MSLKFKRIPHNIKNIYMKSLSLWNVPPRRIQSTKLKLDELYLHKKTNHELHIACLYNLPSYRSGIIGWFVSFLCDFLPKTYIFSSLFKRCYVKFRWVDDAQLISKSISYVNRMIPILNFGTWNTKRHFLNHNKNKSIFKYGADNNRSMSGMFSFFLNTPFYDSGCAILSNVPPFASDFVSFDQNKNLNRGILWSYYNDFQVLVMTVSTDNKDPDDEIAKLLALQKNLSEKFICKNTYIMGEFKREIITLGEFKIKLIDSSSPTSYLIHDYICNPVLENNLIKLNTTSLSPPHHSPRNNNKEEIIISAEEIVIMSPITEDDDNNNKKEEEVQKISEEVQKISEEVPPQSSIFSSIIFNYFSKTPPPTSTPPSKSPPSQSPPSQSPKSDDGWSKV